METKQCKKCDCIYPASDQKCPSCGSKHSRLRKNITVSKAVAMSTELIEVREQKERILFSYFLSTVLLGRFAILWAMHKAKKPKRQIATFAVYDSKRGLHTESVKVGSSRYYKLLSHSK